MYWKKLGLAWAMLLKDSNIVHTCLSDQKKRPMTALSQQHPMRYSTGTTHRAGHAESSQNLLIAVAGVLRALVAVTKQAVRVRLL